MNRIALEPSSFPARLSGPKGVAKTWASDDAASPPAGLVRSVQGTPFMVADRCLVLHGWMDVKGTYPGTVTGLAVGRKADALCFLHATTDPAKPDEPIQEAVQLCGLCLGDAREIRACAEQIL